MTNFPNIVSIFLVLGERRSVQVDVRGDRRYYYASELVEDVKYVFSVMARTSVDWGDDIEGEVVVGPQPGTLK